MGDYATRLCDGKEIKVGTCGAMYYCRWEQAGEIKMRGWYNLDGCLWRIPLPSEDGTKPGDYEYGGLLRDGWCVPYDLRLDTDSFGDDLKDAMTESVGIVQAKIEKLGLLLNIPCHHGIKLPDVGNGGVKAFWNGKNEVLHLCFLKNDEKELLVGVRCSACNHMWSTTFNQIEPYIVSPRMKRRLFRQCTAYWEERNDEPCPYSISSEDPQRRLLTMEQMKDNKGYWWVKETGRNGTYLGKIGSFEECMEYFESNTEQEQR